MDDLTRAIWDLSQHRGNALLMLFLIGESIADGKPCPKLPELAARLDVSDRQAERLEAILKASGELIVTERGGRGRGNRYEIPAIRPLLIARFELQAKDFERRSAEGEEEAKRRICASLGVRPELLAGGHPEIAAALDQPVGDLPEARPLGTVENGDRFIWEEVADAAPPPQFNLDDARASAAPFREAWEKPDVSVGERKPDENVPTSMSGNVESPTELSPFLEISPDINVPTNTSAFVDSPTDSSGFRHKPVRNVPTSMSERELLTTTTNTTTQENKESSTRAKGKRKSSDEIPFPDDFDLSDEMVAWAEREFPGLMVRQASAQWADKAIQKGWTAVGLRGWKAAWRNGMRAAYRFAINNGGIKFDPGRPAPPVQPDLIPPSPDSARDLTLELDEEAIDDPEFLEFLRNREEMEGRRNG